MNKIKFLTSALCTISIAANFSACGKNANTPVSATAGTEAPEVVSTAFDTYSETLNTKTEQSEITQIKSEIISQKSKKIEITEKYPEIFAEMPEKFSEIEGKILYNDGENVFAAEEYINSLMNSQLFLNAALDMELDRLHLADLDGDGLPEIIVDITEYKDGRPNKINHHIFAVSPETKIAGPAMPETDYAKLYEELLDNTDKIHFAYASRKVSWCRTEDVLKEVLSELAKMYISYVPDIYSEISDTIIYDDGENVLTAGEYIDSLIEYPNIIRGAHRYQIADIDGNGIPELAAYVGMFPITTYIAVSPEGQAEMLYDSEGSEYIEADLPVPYESNGKTVWVTDFFQGGSSGGGGYRCFLSIENNTVKTEIISNYDYGKIAMLEYQYNYYWGNDQSEPVSEDEYESRFDDLLAGMENSSAAYVQHEPNEYDYDFPEFLAYMLREYLES